MIKNREYIELIHRVERAEFFLKRAYNDNRELYDKAVAFAKENRLLKEEIEKLKIHIQNYD